MIVIMSTLGAHTLGGTIAVVLLILIIRIRQVKLKAKWRCLAWFLLCLRLAVPIPSLLNLQITSQAPIQLQLPIYVISTEEAVQDGFNQSTNAISFYASGQSRDSSPNIVETRADTQAFTVDQIRPNLLRYLPKIIFTIWLTGAMIMALWIIIAHFRFLHYVHRWAVLVCDSEVIQEFKSVEEKLGLTRHPQLLYCAGLPSPVLAGLFKPVLLLSHKNSSKTSLYHTFLHELIHYRRRDLWFKALALWVNVLHWFNPFMWYMVHLIECDIELACDDVALSHLSPCEYKIYGLTILNTIADEK